MYKNTYQKKYLYQAKIKKKYNFKIFTKYTFLAFVFFVFISGCIISYPYILNYLNNITLFNITKIEVKGNEILDYDDIIKHSGVIPNKTSIFINKKNIIDNLKKNELIDDVNIYKNYPDKIIINIKENKPVAVINFDELYYINEKGKIYKKVDKNQNINLPIITGIKKEDMYSNNLPYYAMNAIEIIKYSSKGIRILGLNNISEISFKNDNYITIYTNDNAIPIYIKLTNLKLDYSRLESILNHLYRTGLYEKTKKIVINTDKKLYYVSFGEQI